MISESVGGRAEVGEEPGFEGSETDVDDNGSMETDGGAVMKVKNVTGSVAIS